MQSRTSAPSCSRVDRRSPVIPRSPVPSWWAATTCGSGKYARKHAPGVNFTNVPPANSVPFLILPGKLGLREPADGRFCHPKSRQRHARRVHHPGRCLAEQPVRLRHLGKGQQQPAGDPSWNQDDNGENNQIPTIFYGANVKTGAYGELVSHYNVLSTLERCPSLGCLTGNAAAVPPLLDIWVRFKKKSFPVDLGGHGGSRRARPAHRATATRCRTCASPKTEATCATDDCLKSTRRACCTGASPQLLLNNLTMTAAFSCP